MVSTDCFGRQATLDNAAKQDLPTVIPSGTDRSNDETTIVPSSSASHTSNPDKIGYGWTPALAVLRNPVPMAMATNPVITILAKPRICFSLSILASPDLL